MAPSFDPAKDIPSLEGKVILVTGGNTGLGKQAIQYLAAHSPTRIYLAARTESKATAAIREIQTSFPNASIEYLPLDLSSFSSIATAASTFTQRESRLDILLNNAGVMMTPYELTKDGYEIQIGTNHMGHALLTKLLLPTLLATAKNPDSDVRVVNVSSFGHHGAMGTIEFNPSKWEKQWTSVRYGQSKLANILYTRELAARHPELMVVSIHPGVIFTDLFNAARSHWLMRLAFPLYSALFNWFPGHYKTTEEGTRNHMWAATVDRKVLESGAYYMPVGKKSGGSWAAQNMGLAKKLWEWTETEFQKHGY
ncbi:unnamed protein product [Periconia digitata]|uniref:Oxidoreductase n=1 Tax=Periconia digitata TaxID=1303443 RepID=A0A9W4U1L1_9PLEO|nr:unnamed protein product [Periconia digitata]